MRGTWGRLMRLFRRVLGGLLGAQGVSGGTTAKLISQFRERLQLNRLVPDRARTTQGGSAGLPYDAKIISGETETRTMPRCMTGNYVA